MDKLTSRRDRFAMLAAVPLLLLALAGCGAQNSGGENDQPAQDGLQWRLDFAECMRGEGIDVEDPGPTGLVAGTGPEDETPERQAATDKCLNELGSSPVQSGSGGTQQVEQDQLKIAECLRDNGFDVEDPTSGGSVVLPEALTEDVAEKCDVNTVEPAAPQ